MEGLKLIPYIALVITIGGLILGASLITMDEFGSTIDDCWNSSYTLNTAKNGCTNNTEGIGAAGKGNLNLTDEYYTKLQAVKGLGNISDQQPTVAIIAVMVIIISVIAGVFTYMRFFR